MNLRVTVIGTGYLGATHAVCLAELGCEVLGVDRDAVKVARLVRGEAPFYEPGLADLLRRHTRTGQLRFSTTVTEAARFADVHFLCVGTPQRPHGLAASTDYLVQVVDELVPHIDRDSLLVGKSTLPVGTSELLAARASRLARCGVAVEVAYNPEFLREGHAVQDSLRPDRIVLGVATTGAEKALREVYAPLLDDGVPLVATDVATAELVKLAANTFLATKLSFINAMAQLCDAVGGDVVTLAQALGYDARIGGEFLNAGLGFGGGCLPKDLRATMASAVEQGADDVFALLREVESINAHARRRVVDIAVAVCGGSASGRRIGVLGAAFKPGTDDVRDSPSLDVAAQLTAQGAHVRVYDPRANGNAAALRPDLKYAHGLCEAVRDTEVVLLLTEWPEFLDADPRSLMSLVRKPCIVDGRNALDAERWRAAGWTYRGVGR